MAVPSSTSAPVENCGFWGSWRLRTATILTTAVEHVPRIAMVTRGKLQYQCFRQLRNPDRLFYDLVGMKLPPHRNAAESIHIGCRLVKRVRVSQTAEGVTGIVLDLLQPVQVVV